MSTCATCCWKETIWERFRSSLVTDFTVQQMRTRMFMFIIVFRCVIRSSHYSAWSQHRQQSFGISASRRRRRRKSVHPRVLPWNAARQVAGSRAARWEQWMCYSEYSFSRVTTALTYFRKIEVANSEKCFRFFAFSRSQSGIPSVVKVYVRRWTN